ncbi:MAG: hypothetical protein IKL71_03735 [Bacteroidaceae bacterium]|nr:hypothetical protein [Bacteroidaceae bacterium]
MKRIISAILLVALVALPSSAQYTPLVKYDVVPRSYEHVFLDYIKDFHVRLIDAAGGQYAGQTDGRLALYGYGQFINDSGDVIVGKFRNGDLLQGVIVGKDNATVGGKDFYCSYSLATGKLQYISRKGVMELPQVADSADYTFMSQTFGNGDRYVGEFYKGKRHGLGIYYYATGGLWFGIYEGDIRNGFGAWFKETNDMVIGLWEGEDERRRVFVPVK